jgi:hypothetical protein
MGANNQGNNQGNNAIKEAVNKAKAVKAEQEAKEALLKATIPATTPEPPKEVAQPVQPDVKAETPAETPAKVETNAETKTETPAKTEAPALVIPESLKNDQTIKALQAIPDEVMRDDAIRNYLKLILKNQELEVIVQKPSRTAKLLEMVNSPTGEITTTFEKVVKEAGLTVEDLKDFFVHIAFQGGKIVVKMSTKADATSQLRSTGGGGSGRGGSGAEVKQYFTIDGADSSWPKSAHGVAIAFKVKYEGIATSEKVLSECQRYDSGAYFRNGEPVMKPNGSLDKEQDYIRTEAKAKELNVDLSGTVKPADSRYHPFFFTWTEVGKHDGKPLMKLTKVEAPVDDQFRRIKA